MEDKSSFEKIKDDDSAEIARLYTANKALVAMAAKNLKLSQESATDLYQDAFLRLILEIKTEKIKNTRSVKGVLYGIMRELHQELKVRKSPYMDLSNFQDFEVFPVIDTTVPSDEIIFNFLNKISIKDKMRLVHERKSDDMTTLQITIPNNVNNDTLLNVAGIIFRLRETYKNDILINSVKRGSIIIEIKCQLSLAKEIIDSLSPFIEHNVEVLIKSSTSIINPIAIKTLQKIKVGFCQLTFERSNFTLKLQPSLFILYLFFLNHPGGALLKQIGADYKNFFEYIFNKLNYEQYCEKKDDKAKDSIFIKFLEQINSKISLINKHLLSNLSSQGFNDQLIEEYKITGKKADIYVVSLAAKSGFLDLGDFDFKSLKS